MLQKDLPKVFSPEFLSLKTEFIKACDTEKIGYLQIYWCKEDVNSFLKGTMPDFVNVIASGLFQNQEVLVYIVKAVSIALNAFETNELSTENIQSKSEVQGK